MKFPDGPMAEMHGMIVLESTALPEGIIMFKAPDGRVIGIIDNRQERDSPDVGPR